MTRCSICYTVLTPAERVTACPDCRQDYHQACWDEIGGCGSYGCKQAAVAQKPPVPVLVGQGWGDTKPCPSCMRPISSSLLVCSCGAKFPWADPMTPAEYQSSVAKDQAIARARKVLIAMFLLSLVGITAPLAGLIAGFFAWRKRHVLVGTGGTYVAMGYGSAALGAFYTLLIVVVALGR